MISFDNVWKRYSRELFKPTPIALQNLSFSLPYGKTLGLIGANGAGKSTSIRLLMDFIRPDKGSIRVLGKSPTDYKQRKLIGYLPETASFPTNLTILDLIRFTAIACDISKRNREEQGEELLHKLGLWDSRTKPLRHYSKGMQQRANFVLALLNDPDLFILDEPMSGLDPIGRGQIISLIELLKQKGKTILFCSHLLSDVDKLADLLLVLHKGQCLFSGVPIDLLKQFGEDSIEKSFLALIDQYERKG